MNVEEISVYTAKDIRRQAATEILRDVMHFNQLQAMELIAEILAVMKTNNSNRGDLAAMLFKKYAESTELVVKCAEKLAPYESARLQSIEVKSEVEHRFVIRAPEVAKSSEEWFKQVEDKKTIDLQVKEFQAIDEGDYLDEDDE